MIILVRVKSSSSERKIEEFGDFHYLVHVKTDPEKGEANTKLLNILSKYLGVPVGRIKIKMGLTFKDKVLEIT